MRITIDNEDGAGAIDYTASVTADGPIRIARSLNAPSLCSAVVVPSVYGLTTPARRGRVVVANDTGTVLFTGYLVTEPVPLYTGAGVSGPLYRYQLNAVSDEWLLDRQGSGANATTNSPSVNTQGVGLIAQLTQAVQSGPTATSTSVAVLPGGNARAVGAFAVQPSAGWSTNAAAAANAAYATYRVVNGAVSVSSAGSVTHSFSDTDGSLDPAALSVSHLRELANDVTVSGTEEAAALVQEIFQGDGTTTEFILSNAAFRDAHRKLIADGFEESSFDPTQWVVADGGGHLQLTSAGLTISGGNGMDGQTTLQAVSAVEMGGFLLAELNGVVFGAGSNGTIASFYNGAILLTNCFAGYHVRQSVSSTGSSTVVVPVVNGVEVGSLFTPVAGHAYTVRLRLYCGEMQRILQRFYCMVDGDVEEFGSVNGVNAPMQVVFEIVDEGASSNTPVTVLYDSAAEGATVATSPGACTFVAVNSVSLFGSISTIQVTRPGSLWVVSTLPDGSTMTRLAGEAGQGVDCSVEYGSEAGSPGNVSFFAGRVPQPNERVSVFYRTQQRAVARLADQSSILAEAAAGAGVTVPGVSRWLGKVIAPMARSSADCEAAAEAILAMATARAAALAGSYSMVNPAQDVWPGDVLQIAMDGSTFSVLARQVQIEEGHGVPELVMYKVRFANDWATEWQDGLGLKLSDTIAGDATLPVLAESMPGQVLANLQQLSVTALSGSAVQVNAGVSAPTGGGFEVRRRDSSFGVGTDLTDLVLRSPVPSFSLPRSSQKERFYVRMYDGSSPPLYSRFSSAVLVNWPMS